MNLLTKTFPVSARPSPEGTELIVDVGGGIMLRAVTSEKVVADGEATLRIPVKRIDNAKP